jgi:hypothetical protein
MMSDEAWFDDAEAWKLLYTDLCAALETHYYDAFPDGTTASVRAHLTWQRENVPPMERLEMIRGDR